MTAALAGDAAGDVPLVERAEDANRAASENELPVLLHDGSSFSRRPCAAEEDHCNEQTTGATAWTGVHRELSVARPASSPIPPYRGAAGSEQYGVTASCASASTGTARCAQASSSLHARHSAARPSAEAWLAQRW